MKSKDECLEQKHNAALRTTKTVHALDTATASHDSKAALLAQFPPEISKLVAEGGEVDAEVSDMRARFEEERAAIERKIAGDQEYSRTLTEALQILRSFYGTTAFFQVLVFGRRGLFVLQISVCGPFCGVCVCRGQSRGMLEGERSDLVLPTNDCSSQTLSEQTPQTTTNGTDVAPEPTLADENSEAANALPTATVNPPEVIGDKSALSSPVGNYAKHEGGGSIIQLLEAMLQETEAKIADDSARIGKLQAQFLEEQEKLNKLKRSLAKERTSLEASEAEGQSDVVELEGVVIAAGDTAQGALRFKNAVDGACKGLLVNFGANQEKRAAEIEFMQQARMTFEGLAGGH